MRLYVELSRKQLRKQLSASHLLHFTIKNAEAALTWAEVDSDLRRNAFSPLSVWGIVCGLTRISQQSAFTDERVAIDRAAGKLMSMVC